MGLFEEAREWGVTVLFLIVILYVAIKFIEIFCAESGLFCQTVFGGGIFVAIVAGIIYFIKRKI
jgi:hypothetical protein